MLAAMPITTRELTRRLWPDLEHLLERKFGGCWCWFWRLERGEKWADVKGDEAKRRMRGAVRRGRVMGILAYDGGEPIGWCAFGPKPSYPRLARAPSLRTDDAERVWSLPCFVVQPKHRRRGVATKMLAAAVAAIKRRGGRVVEGYPIEAKRPFWPAATYTGTVPMFERCGFDLVQLRPAGKQRMRRGT